jgi:hypothetical protein
LSLAEDHGGEIQLVITDVVMPETNGRELAVMEFEDAIPSGMTFNQMDWQADSTMRRCDIIIEGCGKNRVPSLRIEALSHQNVTLSFRLVSSVT